MPPKVKTTKDDIIHAAINLVREGGAEAINARNIAAALKCSTQPVFSNFASMTELKFKVIEEADKLYNKYIN
ncbi:MAG: TetR family transcriptional regulator, partial [Clostridia bacterium]|nr:TetR family transcriptional regulator [Clostridia bacterium]